MCIITSDGQEIGAYLTSDNCSNEGRRVYSAGSGFVLDTSNGYVGKLSVDTIYAFEIPDWIAWTAHLP
jgi:hypothetical protein